MAAIVISSNSDGGPLSTSGPVTGSDALITKPSPAPNTASASTSSVVSVALSHSNSVGAIDKEEDEIDTSDCCLKLKSIYQFYWGDRTNSERFFAVTVTAAVVAIFAFAHYVSFFADILDTIQEAGQVLIPIGLFLLFSLYNFIKERKKKEEEMLSSSGQLPAQKESLTLRQVLKGAYDFYWGDRTGKQRALFVVSILAITAFYVLGQNNIAPVDDWYNKYTYFVGGFNTVFIPIAISLFFSMYYMTFYVNHDMEWVGMEEVARLEEAAKEKAAQKNVSAPRGESKYS